MIQEWVWRKTLVWEGEPVLELFLRRPELPRELRSLRAIDRYYARLSDRWQARWSNVVYPRACQALTQARADSRPFRPWRAELDYQITLEEPGLLSLYWEAREQGQDRVWTVRGGNTWDTSVGAPLPLAASLPKELRRRRALLDLVCQTTEQRLQSGESLLFSDALQRAKQSFSSRRYYLTPDHVMLFYPMLSLGSAGEGIPVFPLPRTPAPLPSPPEKS